MTAHELNKLANVETRRGIELLSCGDEVSLRESLLFFERAISLRRELPLDDDPIFRWGLSAGWLNRGDALRSLGELSEAVRSYDESLAVLGELEQSAAVVNRTALARNGRGLASGSIEDFTGAIDAIGAPVDLVQTITLAAALLHRSQVQMNPESVQADAEASLDLVKAYEFKVEEAAEIGLKARHCIGRCWCEWVDSTSGTMPPVDDWIAATTDLVEDALALERAWERAGVRSMRDVARDLFRLGLKVYGTCQPHFLAEFLLESIDPIRSPGAPSDDPHFQAAAVKALKETMAGVLGQGTSHLDDEVARQLALIDGLRAADRRLAELQGT